jgi:hypothetical protein
MARPMVLTIAALNVAQHAPHTPSRYVDLLRKAYNQRQIVERGTTHGMLLGSLYVNEDSTRVTGEIYSFINLDPSEPWFDLVKRDEAQHADVKQIHIPENLKPHLARYPFVFLPKGHRLYYLTKDKKKKTSLGPRAAKSFLEHVFSHPDIAADHGPVDVTVEPDREQLSKVLALATIRTLKIEVKRPNPDDHDSDEERVLKRLEQQNSRRMTIELKAEPNQTIKPDEETKMHAKVAASNGHVESSGRDANDKPDKRSTIDQPLVERAQYDPNLETEYQVLDREAERIHQDLTAPQNV